MDEYLYDECESCLWRDGNLIPLCDACDEADQYEPDFDIDIDQDRIRHIYPIIKILEIA